MTTTGGPQAADSLHPPPAPTTPRVVVVGGGFGGAYAARSVIRRTGGAVDVTIVSATNFLLFTPLLPEAACGAIEPRHVVTPLRHMLPHARVVLGSVTAVDPARRVITVRQPDRPDREIAYDRLILAPGGVPRVLPVPGLVDHAVGVKTLAEGIWLRNRTIEMLELAESEPDEQRRRAMLSFTFVGGGYAGVEFLAELQSMVDRILRYYPRLDPLELRWTLVDAGPGILREVGGDLGEYATRRLERRGIRVLRNTTVQEVTSDSVVLSTGERVPCRTLVWAAGVVPSPLVSDLGAPLDRGRVIVDEQMRVPGAEFVWALGDCAAVPNAAEGGRFCPPTSQHALRQATRAGLNVAASLGYGVARPFSYKPKGGLATLGVGDGVAAVFGIRVRGWLAWFMARGYHLVALPTFSKKIRVALDWTLQLATPYDIVQLSQLGHPPRIDEAAAPPPSTADKPAEQLAAREP